MADNDDRCVDEDGNELPPLGKVPHLPPLPDPEHHQS